MQNNSHYIAALIKRQWIRDTYVPSDLFTIDVLDEDFVGGYKPMIFTMKSLREILIESLSFIDLPDTPDTYAGFSGQVPIVNPTEDGLIFVDYVDTFLELTDTPIDYIGMAGYQTVVNGTEDGLEFIPIVPPTPPYVPPVVPSHYEARLNFNGANDPVVTQLLRSELFSTFPITMAWNRISQGRYQAVSSVPVLPQYWSAWIGQIITGPFVIVQYNPSSVVFEHYDTTGSLFDATQNEVCVEIKLHYP